MGDPALRVDASRLLLRAALEVQHNQQFLLLSEDCVPLYPAQVVWQQLASEQRSRVNACKGVRTEPTWTLSPLGPKPYFLHTKPYPAQMVWQLASEQRSRVNACKGVHTSPLEP